MYPHQTERLDGVLEAFGVDALVATSPADVAYLTGFWSLSHAVFDAEILAVYSKAGTALVIPTIDAPAVGAVARARAVKSPYEIDCLAQTLRIAEESIHAVLGELKPGTTEREAVALYEHAVTAQRAAPYAATITFGENAALPAAYPSERALRAGELVRFDLGCVFKGYRGDVARMAVVGEPGEREQRAYDAVEAGVQAALDAIRPGVEGGAVFEAAGAPRRAARPAGIRPRHLCHRIRLEPGQSPLLTARRR